MKVIKNFFLVSAELKRTISTFVILKKIRKNYYSFLINKRPKLNKAKITL